MGEKGDARGSGQVALFFNYSVFVEWQLRIGAERGIGKCRVEGKGQQWVPRSA